MRINGSSLKGAASRPAGIFLGGDFVLVRTVKIAMICRPRIINAAVLMVHPYPTLGIMRPIMMGKITPPSDEPVTMMPMAVARFFANHVVKAASASESQ